MAFWNSSQSQRRDFEVVIYENDYKQLCAWVLKKTNIETGGDLFGLWADKHAAVIQFVVGPGQGCRRSSVSFYQDISYLERIGSHMTQHEGLCHIGEWHSHHQLGLARPSGGDENTVWNNMPTYNLKRFVIFIANIESSRQNSYNVNIGCFLFELESVKGKEKQLPVLQGTFKILQKESPFNGKLLEKRNKDAEKDNKKEIEIKDLEMKISQQPQVTYFTKSTSFSNKRHQLDEESGNQTEIEKKKSRKEKKATSVGNENTQGNKNMTPDDTKRGESRGQKETHKTVTSDSNERNESHESQAENSSGARKNDEGNTQKSGGEGTDSAGDPRTLEKNEEHEVQPGNQQSEGNADGSTASHNKTQGGTSNKEPNDKEGNAKPSEVEGGNSTDANDQNASDDKIQQGNPSKESNNDGQKAMTEEGNSTDQHSKEDQDHETQPPSQVPEGDATDHNASKNKTQEETSTEQSHKDGDKAMTEEGKSTEDAEPPPKEPDEISNQVDEDQTSSPKKLASGQGKAPTVGKQAAKSGSQKSGGDANNPQNRLKDQPVPKSTAKNKLGPLQLRSGPGSAKPVNQQAGKEGKVKGGGEKKGGKSNKKKPPK